MKEISRGIRAENERGKEWEGGRERERDGEKENKGEREGEKEGGREGSLPPCGGHIAEAARRGRDHLCVSVSVSVCGWERERERESLLEEGCFVCVSRAANASPPTPRRGWRGGVNDTPP